MQLITGTITALFREQHDNPLTQKPVLQILFPEKLKSSSSQTRYKCYLSDSAYYIKAVFVTKITAMFENNTLNENSIISFDQWTIKEKDGEKILIVYDVLQYKNSTKIGNPINIHNQKTDDSCKKRIKTENSMQELSNDIRNNNINKENNNQAASNDIRNNNINKENIQERTIKTENNNQAAINKTSVKSNVKTNENVPKSFITSIQALTPFYNTWTIKGTCTYKSQIKTFTTQKGDGKLFSIMLTDETGTIKVTSFSDTVDLFYNFFDVGKQYLISKATVKLANAKYNSGTTDYEIYLDKNTEVKISYDENAPKYFFKFTAIQDLLPQQTTDVIGAVKNVYAKQTIKVKSTGKETAKKDLILIDTTGNIRATLWGDLAETEINEGDVLAINNASVREYNGVTLSTYSSSSLHVYPDIDEAFAIKGWYENTGKDLRVKETINDKIKTIEEMKETKWATILGTITFMKEESIFYDACIYCAKKVVSDDSYVRCEKCDLIIDTCNKCKNNENDSTTGTMINCRMCDKMFSPIRQKYIIQAQMGDFTGQTWLNFFDEQGAAMFGMSASELKILKEEASQMEDVVKSLYFKEFICKVGVKTESYNGEERKRYNCRNIEAVDYVKQGKNMLKEIMQSMQ